MVRTPRLTAREKAFLIPGIVALGLLLGNQFIAKPMRERLSTVTRVVESKDKTLRQLKEMGIELKTLRSEVIRIHREIEAQPDKGRVLALLERIQEEQGLSSHVIHMRPSGAALGKRYEETTIEIKLDAVTLEQLLGFLEKLADLNLAIGVKWLEIKHTTDTSGSLLEATLKVSTISPAT